MLINTERYLVVELQALAKDPCVCVLTTFNFAADFIQTYPSKRNFEDFAYFFKKFIHVQLIFGTIIARVCIQLYLNITILFLNHIHNKNIFSSVVIFIKSLCSDEVCQFNFQVKVRKNISRNETVDF